MAIHTFIYHNNIYLFATGEDEAERETIAQDNSRWWWWRERKVIEDASAVDGGVIVHKDTHSPMKVSKWDIIQ